MSRSETKLIFRRIGNYTTLQSKVDDKCEICGNGEWGDILVTEDIFQENKQYYCVGCLLSYYKSQKELRRRIK